MNRPDFREIRRLIDSLRALDQNFQQMFAQAQAFGFDCSGHKKLHGEGSLHKEREPSIISAFFVDPRKIEVGDIINYFAWTMIFQLCSLFGK